MTKANAVLYLSLPQKIIIYVTETTFEYANTKQALSTPTACNIMVTYTHTHKTKQKPNLGLYTHIPQAENVNMPITFTDLLT